MLKRYFRLVIAILFYFKINQLLFDERSNIILFITLIDFSFSFFFSKKKIQQIARKSYKRFNPFEKREKLFNTLENTPAHTLSLFFFAHIHTHSLSHTHTLSKEEGGEGGLSTSSEYVYLLIGTFCPVERSDKLSVVMSQKRFGLKREK